MDKKKNLIIVADSGIINGGAAKIAIQTAILAAKEGLRVYFFCGTDPVNSQLRDHGVRVVSLSQLDILNDPNRVRASIQGLWNVKAYKALDCLLGSLSPKDTIVHVHVWCKVLSGSIFRTIRKHNVRLILTLHDYFTICCNGGLYNYQKKTLCKLRPGGFACCCTNCDSRGYVQKLYRFLRLKIQNHYLFNGSPVEAITLCNYSKSVFQDALSLDLFSKVYNVWNPVEFPCCKGGDTGEYYLFIGRLEEDKGIKLFCRVIKELGKKGIVLGDGYLRDELQLKYHDCIEFKGWVNSDEIGRVASQCKALIVGTLWHETFGLSVLEMKGMGVPAIVPDSHASSDFIKNGYDGIIYKSGDLQSLKDAVLEFEKYGKSYYKSNITDSFNRDPFSFEAYIKKIMSIYGC